MAYILKDCLFPIRGRRQVCYGSYFLNPSGGTKEEPFLWWPSLWKIIPMEIRWAPTLTVSALKTWFFQWAWRPQDNVEPIKWLV